tara:strand:- start:9 stop:1415 length:1407 start_codon:yes stop_codon:yes gene_type:complete
MDYNINSKTSILNYSKKLEGKSISDLVDHDIEKASSDKGSFGKYVERIFFKYDNNSDKNPDFPYAKWDNNDSPGLELKTAEVYLLKSNKYSVSNKLNLNSINYHDIINEDFISSYFIKKNRSTLILFYIKASNHIPFSKRLFDTVGIWDIPKKDLIVIRKDWEFIKNKVLQGEAHKLSEKDTIYLGAGTAGNSNSMTSQPNSDEPARVRKLTFKSSYIKAIYEILKNPNNFSTITKESDLKEKTITEIITGKLEKFKNKSTEKLGANYSAKQKYERITKKILGAKDSKHEIEELKKAGVEIKTVRINNKNQIEQHMSFPAFKFTDIVNEDWKSSKIKSMFEDTLLIVFFREKVNGHYYLDNFKLWNLRSKDLCELESVYQKLKKCLLSGEIVDKVTQKVWNNFPKTKDNHISHIRPHSSYGYLHPKGKKPGNIYDLPVADKKTGWTSFTRHSFWLNKTYIMDIYNNKL